MSCTHLKPQNRVCGQRYSWTKYRHFNVFLTAYGFEQYFKVLWNKKALFFDPVTFLALCFHVENVAIINYSS